MSDGITRERAGQLAGVIAALQGVRSVTVVEEGGVPLGSAGASDPRRDAGLATFLASRIRTMTAEGDLRGKGRVLRESQLLFASCSGRDREYVLVPWGEVSAFAVVRTEAVGEIVAPEIIGTLQGWS